VKREVIARRGVPLVSNDFAEVLKRNSVFGSQVNSPLACKVTVIYFSIAIELGRSEVVQWRSRELNAGIFGL
jgi:hypothetical protein